MNKIKQSVPGKKCRLNYDITPIDQSGKDVLLHIDEQNASLSIHISNHTLSTLRLENIAFSLPFGDQSKDLLIPNYQAKNLQIQCTSQNCSATHPIKLGNNICFRISYNGSLHISPSDHIKLILSGLTINDQTGVTDIEITENYSPSSKLQQSFDLVKYPADVIFNSFRAEPANLPHPQKVRLEWNGSLKHQEFYLTYRGHQNIKVTKYINKNNNQGVYITEEVIDQDTTFLLAAIYNGLSKKVKRTLTTEVTVYQPVHFNYFYSDKNWVGFNSGTKLHWQISSDAKVIIGDDTTITIKPTLGSAESKNLTQEEIDKGCYQIQSLKQTTEYYIRLKLQGYKEIPTSKTITVNCEYIPRIEVFTIVQTPIYPGYYNQDTDFIIKWNVNDPEQIITKIQLEKKLLPTGTPKLIDLSGNNSQKDIGQLPIGKTALKLIVSYKQKSVNEDALGTIKTLNSESLLAIVAPAIPKINEFEVSGSHPSNNRFVFIYPSNVKASWNISGENITKMEISNKHTHGGEVTHHPITDKVGNYIYSDLPAGQTILTLQVTYKIPYELVHKTETITSRQTVLLIPNSPQINEFNISGSHSPEFPDKYIFPAEIKATWDISGVSITKIEISKQSNGGAITHLPVNKNTGSHIYPNLPAGQTTFTLKITYWTIQNNSKVTKTQKISKTIEIFKKLENFKANHTKVSKCSDAISFSWQKPESVSVLTGILTLIPTFNDTLTPNAKKTITLSSSDLQNNTITIKGVGCKATCSLLLKTQNFNLISQGIVILSKALAGVTPIPLPRSEVTENNTPVELRANGIYCLTKIQLIGLRTRGEYSNLQDGYIPIDAINVDIEYPICLTKSFLFDYGKTYFKHQHFQKVFYVVLYKKTRQSIPKPVGPTLVWWKSQ
ncbi:MAG: hypothetical protein AAGA77_24025 [Bacteroidota bacterium]